MYLTAVMYIYRPRSACHWKRLRVNLKRSFDSTSSDEALSSCMTSFRWTVTDFWTQCLKPQRQPEPYLLLRLWCDELQPYAKAALLFNNRSFLKAGWLVDLRAYDLCLHNVWRFITETVHMSPCTVLQLLSASHAVMRASDLHTRATFY